MDNKRQYKGKSIIADIHNYTVIDLETTGRNVNECEIIELAAVKVENDEIVGEYSTLVQPSVLVPSRVTQITGITNEMLVDAPHIEDVIEDFLDFIGEDVILGHNISSFDSVILYDLCEGFGLPHLSNDMLDTLCYARRCNIIVPNYKLTTLTKYFGIEHSDAHRALGDCIANHQCYLKLKDFFDDSIRRPRTSRSNYAPRNSEETNRLHELLGIVKGIISDDELSDKEILYLDTWLKQNENLAGNYPFDIISESIRFVLEDGVITAEEKTYLLDVLSEFDDPVSKRACSVDGEVFSGRNIVLTGDFIHGSRDDISNELEAAGFTIQNSVTKKTDYLVVGEYGSAQWSQGNYGTKVKKAIELQEKGCSIKIIKEREFFDSLNKGIEFNNSDEPNDDFQKGQQIIGIKDLFDRINREIANEQRIPENVLFLEINDDVQSKSESVWIKEPLTGKRSKLVFNCYMRGKKDNRYATFVIQNSLAKAVAPPKNVELKVLPSDSLHTFVNVKEINDEFEGYIKAITAFCIKSFEPADKFGCCSKYKECSDAKECLHNNLFYSKACWYRKNLEAGKIFY